MQTLIGEKLNQEKANQILREIELDLRPRHYVVKRISKGSDPQHIVLIYEIKKVRWIPFRESPIQRVVYHSKQNFSGDVTIPIDFHHDNRLLFGGSNDQDEL